MESKEHLDGIETTLLVTEIVMRLYKSVECPYCAMSTALEALAVIACAVMDQEKLEKIPREERIRFSDITKALKFKVDEQIAAREMFDSIFEKLEEANEQRKDKSHTKTCSYH